ncbi:MAG TPA: cytidylate kinase family protein [Candidatus Paceibacterota bacterium]|nr:cytidylate kinase family protein [Candidatus Paceibacterota bacterium]
MTKKHIITIAGKLGSGKSSTSKMVASLLSYEHASTGDFMRRMAEERGIKLDELSKIAETDDSVDLTIDKYTKELGDKNNIVIDSRLGFYFIPDSFKVFLELDSDIAAERILEDKKSNPYRHNEAFGFNTKEEVMESINNRSLSERKRYKNLYEIEDITSHNNFDLVIDTSKMPLHEVAKKVIDEYYNWLKN